MRATIIQNLLLCLAFHSAAGNNEHNNEQHRTRSSSKTTPLRGAGGRGRRRRKTNSHHDDNALPKTEGLFQIEKAEDMYFKNLIKRMKPHFLQVHNDTDIPSSSLNMDSLDAVAAQPVPYNPPVKQFYHLHHMKTGGTSLEGYISCALRRYTKFYNLLQTDRQATRNHNDNENTQVEIEGSSQNNQHQNKKKMHFPEYKLSECSYNYYMRCISGPSNSTCHEQISKASIMTYCAPLAVTRHFGWNDDSFATPSVTMLRNPVERVWSMYRFQTRHCYKCKSLKEVYDDIDSGNITDYPTGVCVPQLVNHFTRNLLTNLTVDELNNDTSSMTEEEKVRDAIHSIKNRFTVVGIIERLEETLKLFSYSFPWLSEEFDSDYYSESDHYYQKYKEANVMYKCEFPHSNASPSNNGCGANGAHMDLPPHPDDETRKIIEEHNKLDIEVYEAALEHFEMQKRAMEYEEEEQLER